MSNVVLEKVSRSFGNFVAVDGVDLRVSEGEFVTLLGPSGCGKTTTLRMVAGLEQNTGGRISIGNEVVSDAGRGVFIPSERRRLGMLKLPVCFLLGSRRLRHEDGRLLFAFCN